MLESVSISVEALKTKSDELRRTGQTVMFVGVDDRAAGLVGVADPIKESAREAIAALHADGIRVVMLTGDNRTTADAVARAVGIDQVEADVLPRSESQRCEEPSEQGRASGHGG
jgi:Cu+-exporting ATPase